MKTGRRGDLTKAVSAALLALLDHGHAVPLRKNWRTCGGENIIGQVMEAAWQRSLVTIVCQHGGSDHRQRIMLSDIGMIVAQRLRSEPLDEPDEAESIDPPNVFEAAAQAEVAFAP